MLTLKCRVGERIMIEPDDGLIVIAVLWAEGQRVQVGIEAPKHMPVNREEIYLIKKRLGRPPKKPDKP